MEFEELDSLDFAILKVIRDADRPLWKKQIHRNIHERTAELPLIESSATHQTVGRRIDDLLNAGYVETEILRPEDVDRHSLIAYRLNAKGDNALNEKRCAYIRDIVRQDIFEGYREENEPIEPLLTAISEEFDLDDDERRILADRYDSVKLAALLALYYVHKETLDLFTQQERQLIRSVATGKHTMSDILQQLDGEPAATRTDA